MYKQPSFEIWSNLLIMSPLQVYIAGAGPVGLAAAASCQLLVSTITQ